MEQSNECLIILFIGLILPIFAANYPETDIRQVFDLFLLEGESAIISVIVRMLLYKKDKLLTLEDADLH